LAYSNCFLNRIIGRAMQRAIYRIIDANFNRGREALRVIEEFCRFGLNSERLTARAKQLRHELSAAINKLDSLGLIVCRDAAGDVGACRTADSQLARRDLKDAFTAGCKRLTEALRVLAETVQTQDVLLAEKLEALRFAAYELEKDIVVFGEPAEKFKRVGLYVIITSDLPAEIISLGVKCAGAGADCLQLRAKGMPDRSLFAVAEEFVRICRDANVVSIINDRADIAVAAGADGVHLGQEDLGAGQVRKLQASPLIIGISTHSPGQLVTACAELPTYVSLGPVFATDTKPSAVPVGLEYVRAGVKQLEGTGIAAVAVGGIGPDDVGGVLEAGADCIAVCSAVTRAKDPAAACRSFRERIDAARQEE